MAMVLAVARFHAHRFRLKGLSDGEIVIVYCDCDLL
jgi:hypothetical protein